jgi:hypothetical protein
MMIHIIFGLQNTFLKGWGAWLAKNADVSKIEKKEDHTTAPSATPTLSPTHYSPPNPFGASTSVHIRTRHITAKHNRKHYSNRGFVGKIDFQKTLYAFYANYDVDKLDKRHVNDVADKVR